MYTEDRERTVAMDQLRILEEVVGDRGELTGWCATRSNGKTLIFPIQESL